MEKKHKAVFRKKRTYLIDNIDPDALMNYLVEAELISDDMEEEIRGETRRSEKTRKILTTVQLRGPTAFSRFLKALEDAGQDFVAKELREEAGESSDGSLVPHPQPSMPSSQAQTFPTLATSQSSFPFPLQETMPPADLSTKANVRIPSQTGTASSETDAGSDNVYKMSAKPRGLALIISNKHFDPKCGMNERRGTDVDAANLDQVFRFLGFLTHTLTDQSVSNMQTNLQALARYNHSDYDAVIVAILTHGVEGKIYGSCGNLVPVKHLIRLFNGDMAPALVGKPKMFFLQACRGDSFDYGKDEADGAPEDDPVIQTAIGSGEDETDANLTSLPVEADMLLAYATVPGYVSWRNSERGSWFVQALVDNLSTYASQEDLVSILVRVNRAVATDFEAKGRRKQMPSPVVQLLKKVHFRPGA